MLAAYALELQALKQELQSTLARLGLDADESESESVDTPVTHRGRRARGRGRRDGPITLWSRRQLMQELAAASARRRELEMQLQQEVQRQQRQQREGDGQERRQRRTSAWQAAIEKLQQQRAEILRQIEEDTAADAAAELDGETERGVEVAEERVDAEAEAPTQQSNRPVNRLVAANNDSVSETQYAIGGVVTLDPLPSQQEDSMVTSSRSGFSFRHAVAAAPPPPSVVDGYPRLHYRNTPDALNDVFSLQVKFAETMLKLEKSVQIRDQLLHRGRISSLPKRNTSTRTEVENGGVRHHGGRHRRRSIEGGSYSDSSAMYRESHSNSSFSSSAYSFSSLGSTPQRSRRLPMRYQNFQASRATTAETAAPSSTSADNSPSLVGTANAAALVSFTPSSRQEASDSFDKTAEDHPDSDSERVPTRELSDEHQEGHQTTPTTGSSVTTPTTGSDQKSNTSSSKQVRFGDDAYSTPVIARKFNFDNPSIDEDDDEPEETEEEAESLLSFLGGSSVTSAELNEISFIQAFERFRRELRATKHDSHTPSRTEPAQAKVLFPSEPSETAEILAPEEDHGHPVESTDDAAVSAPEGQDQAPSFPELAELSIAELQERRRQLCLDIQAESAQLVLNFGARQSTNIMSQDAERTRDCLLALRDELKAIDTRLKELQ